MNVIEKNIAEYTADEYHGGALDSMRRRFPEAPEPWIDLSTGINPWPWPVPASHYSGLNRLPGAAELASCEAAMAAAFGAPRETVLAAPGSEMLIRLLPTVLQPRRVAILAPSYGDHAQVWKQVDCELVESRDPLADAAADAVVICNPNNPDGRRFERTELTEALSRLTARGGWLIVDEAFADLEPGLSIAPLAGSGNLLALRSIGKFFGLAGLRLGALLAPPDIRRAMADRLGSYFRAGAIRRRRRLSGCLLADPDACPACRRRARPAGLAEAGKTPAGGRHGPFHIRGNRRLP